MGEVVFKHYGKVKNKVHFPYTDEGTKAIGSAYKKTKSLAKKSRQLSKRGRR